jgi:DNA-binding response OmpR family regulator
MLRILVVEDDPDIAELVRYNLQAIGLDVIIAADGISALRELRQGSFDLLILDLMLPTVSGLEICKEVRAQPVLQELPVLVMTARGEDAMRELAFSMGATDYLVKPFSPGELVGRVKALLPRPVAEAASRGA